MNLRDWACFWPWTRGGLGSAGVLSAGMLECWNAGVSSAGLLECWSFECWIAGMLEWDWTFGVGGSASLSGLVWVVVCRYQGRTRTGIASNPFALFRNAVGVFGPGVGGTESPRHGKHGGGILRFDCSIARLLEWGWTLALEEVRFANGPPPILAFPPFARTIEKGQGTLRNAGVLSAGMLECRNAGMPECRNGIGLLAWGDPQALQAWFFGYGLVTRVGRARASRPTRSLCSVTPLAYSDAVSAWGPSDC
jgi:hypothetical protein